MTKCIRCNVTVDNQHNRCPLCSKPLKIREESTTEYPSYKAVYQETKPFTVAKLFLFLTISAIMLSITINALTYHINPTIWSIIVSTGLIYAWIVVKDTILSNKHIGRKILYHYVMLSIFLLVIDVFVGFRGWSTNYAIPLFGVAGTFIMTVLAIVQKSLWRHDIGYILAMFFINLCPMLLFVFNLSHVIWTSVFSIVYSLLTIIGMMIFSDRKFISEIRRRFHY